MSRRKSLRRALLRVTDAEVAGRILSEAGVAPDQYAEDPADPTDAERLDAGLFSGDVAALARGNERLRELVRSGVGARRSPVRPCPAGRGGRAHPAR